jgi:DNA invertase Pin-like site-specific DNA recombinase
VSRRRLAAVPDRPRRVVLYVRVSAVMGRSGDDFHSPEVQTAAMRRVTAGMQEVDLIDDDIDQTGRTFSREGIDKIRKLAEARAIDAVAVYDVSRFGRNVLESLQFLSWLAERGVTILSATEQIDTSTPSGRWMLTNLLAIAEMRSDEIGNNWGQIIARRAQAGKHHGRPPIGYRRGADGFLEPHPVEGPAVTRMFEAYASEATVRDIVRDFHKATGRAPHVATVKKMIQNETYRGHVRLRAGGVAGSVEVLNAHEPLVDEVLWGRAQARHLRDTRIPAWHAVPQYALSGLGRCGICGSTINHRLEGKARGRVDTARMFCSRQFAIFDRCSGCGSSDEPKVVEAVLEQVEIYISELKFNIGARAAQIARSDRAGLDAAAVKAELKATLKAKVKAAEGWSRGLMDDRTYQETVSTLNAAEARLLEAQRQLEEVASMPDPSSIIAVGERLLRMWPKLNGPQRNRALKGLVKSVTIMPSSRYRQPPRERIQVEWL